MKRYTYDQNGTAYQLKGGKHTCPSCGHNGTLQLYICNDNGEPINDQVGKCDRHYNCGYDYKPMQYYSDHPEELPPAKDGRKHIYRPQEPQKPLVVIPNEYVNKSFIPRAERGLCTFTDILLQMFAPSDIMRVIEKYYLGYTRNGAVIFWQIDTNGLVREGKAMQYNVFTGGRVKASWATGESKWVFSVLQYMGILPTPATSTKCMFGEHLLRNADNTTNVMITEGEKNAIFGALAYPRYTWLAVGSSQDIGKVWKIKDALSKCRSVVFVPDSDAFQDWREKVKGLHLPNAEVSDLCAGHSGGWDLADIIRDKFLQHPQIFTPTQQKPVPLPTTEAEATAIVEATPNKSASEIVYKTLLTDCESYYDGMVLPPDFFTISEYPAPF